MSWFIALAVPGDSQASRRVTPKPSLHKKRTETWPEASRAATPVCVSSLKVPHRGVKYRWSEGPWPLSLVVVMFPEPSIGEEWQMTESHHFPADGWVQGMGGHDIHGHRREVICQEG